MSIRITPADTARHLAHLVEQRREKGLARASRLRESLPAAVRMLKEDYGARRVFLFGSLATDTFRDRSDLDLAVEGLPKVRYFDALADLMALFGAPLDLVRLEEAPQSLRERVFAEGEVL